jgi:hypothetical protein
MRHLLNRLLPRPSAASVLKSRTRNAKSRIASRRSLFETLENRSLLAGLVFPNDPNFPNQWQLHNIGQTGGLNDADIDMPAAWTVSTGSMSTVVAVLDSGIDYTLPDIYLNMWINESEIPASIASSLIDSDGDTIITFRDLNAPANASYVTDVNGTGYIDSGDLLNDPSWEDGDDEDVNGLVDDIVGWDFYDNDNDPYASLAVADHGSHMSQRLAAMGNDGVGWVGVMWTARLINVRISRSAADRRNNAAGLDYAVAEGATISNNCYGDFTYSQEMYDAIERARVAGHLFVAPAGNFTQDADVSPLYPAAYNLDNIISVAALTSSDQLTSVSNWGQTTVDLGSPSDTGATSKAAPLVTGVAGLLRTLHPDWTYAQIKDQILSTVDPLPALAGKTVTGGRLNAASALGYVPPATKYYVVDDASTNRTLEYEASGAIVEDYGLYNGNTTPRGAASTAAGDKIWVVDANKSVYVYSNSGALLGSWAAGSIPGSPDIQGVTTNGTDIWIVDAKGDKVYRYAGAASRLSGSQNAISNFGLNSGNKDPSDLVTDGTSIWVVNNSSTDKVFKYNAANGALDRSWTITGGGGSPTGITLDPSNTVMDLWIVDSTSDRVYRLPGARTTTATSVAATDPFLLATLNANPQGIADPPVTGIVTVTPVSDARATSPALSANLALATLRPVREATLRPARKLPQPALSSAPAATLQILNIDRPQIVDEALTDYLSEMDETAEDEISGDYLGSFVPS